MFKRLRPLCGLFRENSVQNSCKFLGKPVWKAENSPNETCAEFVDISSGYRSRQRQKIPTSRLLPTVFFHESLFASAWRGEQVREEDSDRRIYAAHAA